MEWFQTALERRNKSVVNNAKLAMTNMADMMKTQNTRLSMLENVVGSFETLAVDALQGEINSLQKRKRELALEMETEKNMYQENIEWMMLKKDWNKLPAIDGRSLDMLALFGDVMVFTPEVSQRIICKLAEQIKRNQLSDPLEEYLS